MKTAILAGTTGMIGSILLELLLMDEGYSNVIALSRKPLVVTHPKLKNFVIDFDALEDYSAQLKGDDIYCCLGTTMKQAGSRDAFRKVDHDYPLSFATITRHGGARQFLLVSAMGADKNSFVFYNRVKGEVQHAIGKLGFTGLHIFQPSLLLGPRRDKRRGEFISKGLMKAIGFIIPRKYKAIDATKVAKAMVVIAHQDRNGSFIYASDVLQSY